MNFKVGDKVVIKGEVAEISEWQGKPIVFIVFENSGGCSVFQEDLEHISVIEEGEIHNV